MFKVLITTTKLEAGVHTLVVEFSSAGEADEAIKKIDKFRKDNNLIYHTQFAIRLN